MKTTYSKRELYALGEPLGNSVTEKKLGYGAIYGGGGGGVIAIVAAVVTVAAAIMTDGASLAVEAGAEAGTAAAAEGAAATEVAATTAETATAVESTAAAETAAAGTETAAAATEATAANSAATQTVLEKVGEGAVRGMVSSGLKDIVTGNTDNLGRDIGIGALSGGFGAGIGSAATNFMDANPIVSGALSGATGSGVNASLHGSNDVLGAMTTGAVAGGAGGAGQMLTQDQNLGPLASGAIKGAIQGGTGAVLRGGSILNNSLIGAAGGAAGSAVGSTVGGETGSKLLGSVLGGTAGSLASGEANTLINGAPTVPGQRQAVQPRTVASGTPRTGMNTASGTPNALAYGNPTVANTRSNLSGQIGIPNQAETSGGTSYSSLAGNTSGAGIQAGSNPVLNTGSASNIAPMSGLNASGLPAELTAGLLTSTQPDNTNSQSDMAAAKLAQLYPNLNPKLASILASNAPQPSQPQTYKRGGTVHMQDGGNPDLMVKLQAIESKAQKTRANTHFMAAQKELGPQTQYAASVPFGNPSGGYNKPITPGYFITHAQKGGSIYGQDYGDGAHSGHNPEFITGATGHYVKGKGDGQSDDIPAMLADGEYVFDADTVAQLGNGSSDAGAKLLDHFRESLREHKRSASSDKIPPKAAPLAYMREALKRHSKG